MQIFGYEAIIDLFWIFSKAQISSVTSPKKKKKKKKNEEEEVMKLLLNELK